jgi:hypothetical protein
MVKMVAVGIYISLQMIFGASELTDDLHIEGARSISGGGRK